MSKCLATSWRGLALSAVVGLGALAVAPAQAGRVITASDSGNGGGTGAAVQDRLFNCSYNNFGFASTDPFSCVGALGYSYNPATNFGVVQGLVDSRWSNWTSTNQSAHVKASFNGSKIFFDAAFAGDLVLVLPGVWADNPLSNIQSGRWSAYYLLEDVEIKPQIDGFSPTEGLRYNLEGTDLPARYNTKGLEVAAISLYQINRVPVPGSLALAALALGGLALVRCCGRRQRGWDDPAAPA